MSRCRPVFLDKVPAWNGDIAIFTVNGQIAKVGVSFSIVDVIEDIAHVPLRNGTCISVFDAS